MRECFQRRVCRRSKDIPDIRTGLGVLDEIAQYNQRPLLRRCPDVKARDGIEETKFGRELGIGDDFLAACDQSAGSSDRSILIGVIIQPQQPQFGAGGIGDSHRQRDGIGVVIVVESCVGAEFQPVREMPFALELSAVYRTLHDAFVVQ